MRLRDIYRRTYSSLEVGKTEIKEQMAKEKEEGELEIQAFRLHNPLKALNKSVSEIEEAKNQLDVAEDFSRGSGWFYNFHTILNIERTLDVPKDLFSNLLPQFENLKKRNRK